MAMTNAELVALIKKNPISFSCVVLSVLLGAGIYFRSGEIPAAEAELAQKVAESERYALNIQNGQQLKEQLEAIATANKAIEARMVRVTNQPINQQYFRVLVRDTGVSMTEYRQNTMAASVPKGAKNAYVPVAFTVTVNGTFAQVMDFLRQVENGMHYCRVLSATFNAGATRNAPLSLQLNLELLGLP